MTTEPPHDRPVPTGHLTPRLLHEEVIRTNAPALLRRPEAHFADASGCTGELSSSVGEQDDSPGVA